MATQMGAITRRNYIPDYSSAVLARAPYAYDTALIRDQKAQTQLELDESKRQFDEGMALQRQQLDQQEKDAKRANLISGLGVVASSPKLFEKFLGSDTASTITADSARGTGAMTSVGGFRPSGIMETVKSGVTDIFGENVAKGFSMGGLGKAGLGGIAGAALGGNDLERAAIGAAVPAVINVGSALFSGGSIIDALSESLFPSIGGALGALGLGSIF